MLSQAKEHQAATLIICGSGNNGGDGYALARHLHNHGVRVILAPLGEPDPKSDAGINRAICKAMNLGGADLDHLDDLSGNASIDLIVDAIFGTGLDRPVSGQAARAIEWINRTRRPVLAADLPSGMDCDSGRALGAAVCATRTVTFVGLKRGFLEIEAQKLLGEVFITDIGAPIELLHRFGRPVESVAHRESPEHEAVETRPRQPGR
jgi:NAD(P)H-hydrate epimerase